MRNTKKTFRGAKLLTYLLLYLITGWIIASSIFLTPHALSSPLLTLLQAVIIFFASILLTRYTLYMLIAPWYRLTHEHRCVRRQTGTLPLVSVLIPAWNEEVGLLSTVKTVLASTYPRLEIVVVNDGSTDGSDAVMRAFLIRYWWSMASLQRGTYPEIIYAYQPNGGKGSALNHAIALAHGSVLVTVDADCIVDRHAVAAFARAFEEDSRVMAAVGNVKIGNTGTIIGKIQQLEYGAGFGIFKQADSVFNTIYIIGGAAGAFRREVFERIGGFSEKNITEDIELSVRIQKEGWKIVYVSDAVVYTEGASTLKGLMKQRLRWKRGWFETFMQHPMFFSRKREHNKLLTWVMLPLALFSNVQLGLEPSFLVALYLFSWFAQNFTSFYAGLVIVCLLFSLQAWGNRHEYGLGDLWLAPIAWLLFYVATLVENYALLMGIWGHIRKQPLKWQRWQRTGASDGK